MEKQYKEIRRITAIALRQLCIREDWYTAGDEEEYRHLLFDLAQNKENLSTEDIIEIAADILEHSDSYSVVGVCIENVAFEVACIAQTYFVEV